MSTADPMQAILNGADPDTVLVRVRTAEGSSFALRRDQRRPIDYLRYRSKNPITDIQFLAAELYAADIAGLGSTTSNTQAVINHMQREKEPWTSEEAAQMRSGTMIKPRFEVHEVNDPSDRMLDAAFRVKRIDERLDKVHCALLRDLLVRELTVGNIAMRWKWQPEAAAVMVRHALATLVIAYEAANEEFAVYARQERQADQQGEI